MGNYIGIGDVEARVPARAPFNTSTKPTASQVGLLIEEAEADVAGALTEGGYVLPISTIASLAFSQVKAACAWCAAAGVENVAVTSGPNDRRDHYQRMCDSAKDAIAAGGLSGVDSGSGTDGNMRWPQGTAIFSRDMSL